MEEKYLRWIAVVKNILDKSGECDGVWAFTGSLAVYCLAIVGGVSGGRTPNDIDILVGEGDLFKVWSALYVGGFRSSSPPGPASSYVEMECTIDKEVVKLDIFSPSRFRTSLERVKISAPSLEDPIVYFSSPSSMKLAKNNICNEFVGDEPLKEKALLDLAYISKLSEVKFEKADSIASALPQHEILDDGFSL